MEREFVPYKQALALKGIGFDEPCIARFIHKQFAMNVLAKWYKHNSNEITTGWISAPTFSQCFKWFREKYQIFPEVLTDCTTEPKFVYTYNTFYGNPKDLTEQEWGWENNIGQYSDIYRTYEDAELECLKKLIEIVENKE
jgi:hypothetical protein